MVWLSKPITICITSTSYKHLFIKWMYLSSTSIHASIPHHSIPVWVFTNSHALPIPTYYLLHPRQLLHPLQHSLSICSLIQYAISHLPARSFPLLFHPHCIYTQFGHSLIYSNNLATLYGPMYLQIWLLYPYVESICIAASAQFLECCC